jgi:hypothetical protein
MQVSVFNKRSRGATQMPRPKSEITDSLKVVSARISQDMFKEWRKLGGAEWLRKTLKESKSKREENAKL